MSEEKKLQMPENEEQEMGAEEKNAQELSPTWAHDVIEDLDDWIESQGIYLRQ